MRLYRRLTGAFAALSVFLGLVLAGQLALNNGSAPPPETAPTAAPTTAPDESQAAESGVPEAEASAESPIVRRDADDPMALGDVDAPVVLVQWTDLRCPFCAAFSRDTMPVLVDEYVDQGLVRIEVHDVAFFGEQSEAAAIAARAAGDQGMFFEYTNAIYAAAPESGHADLPRAALIDFAEQVGVPDIDAFTADLDDPAIAAAMQQSTATAQSVGVTAVPFFLAGGTAVSGAQPVDVFRQLLDEALQAAE